MKRTKQLELAKEIALPEVGPDVFTTRDQLELSDAEKEELLHKLETDEPWRAQVEQGVKETLSFQAAFAEGLIRMVDSGKLRLKGRLRFVRDGATFAACDGDTVLHVLRAKGSETMRAEIDKVIRIMGEELAKQEAQRN